MIRIRIDAREPEIMQSLFLFSCKKYKVTAKVDMEVLDVADYIVGSWGFERKRPDDFISSLKSNRLISQVKELGMNFEKCALVVDGTLEDLHDPRVRGKVHSASVDGMLGRIANTVDGIFFCGSKERMVDLMVKIGVKANYRGVEYTPVRPRPETKDMQLFVLMGVPEIGRGLAQRALDHFGSVEEVFHAIMDGKIKDLSGVGEKKWQTMREVFLPVNEPSEPAFISTRTFRL